MINDEISSGQLKIPTMDSESHGEDITTIIHMVYYYSVHQTVYRSRRVHREKETT